MIYITRRERFNAAHKLFREEWSEEKNNEIFGKCANPNWHGHNYELYITVKGKVDPQTGYFVNLKDLSALLKTLIVDKLDHKNMNLDVNFLKGLMTSTECVSMAIWNEIEKPLKNIGATLHCVRLHETENNFVEYFGEK